MVRSPGFVSLFILPLAYTKMLSLLVSHLSDHRRMMPVLHVHPSWPIRKVKKANVANAMQRGALTDLSLSQDYS